MPYPIEATDVQHVRYFRVPTVTDMLHFDYVSSKMHNWTVLITRQEIYINAFSNDTVKIERFSCVSRLNGAF